MKNVDFCKMLVLCFIVLSDSALPKQAENCLVSILLRALKNHQFCHHWISLKKNIDHIFFLFFNRRHISVDIWLVLSLSYDLFIYICIYIKEEYVRMWACSIARKRCHLQLSNFIWTFWDTCLHAHKIWIFEFFIAFHYVYWK